MLSRRIYDFHPVECAPSSKKMYRPRVIQVAVAWKCLDMGVLVKLAQNVEDGVGAIRQQSEPKLKLRLREARAEWLELKSRSKSSTWAKTELHTRATIARVDARLRRIASQTIGRIIIELERIRRRINPAA